MSEKKFEHVLVEKNEEGNYAVISINRPDKLNALTTQTLREIYEAMEQFELESSVRCIVLRGTKNVTKKPAFSAGADLSAPMGKGLKFNIPVHWTISMQQKHRYYTLIEQFPKPVIGAVDGFAFGGGCELTLVCDILIATKRSFFGFPEIGRGILPGNGGTQRMARRIGLNRALNMIFFGERVPAEKMHEWGHVSYLCDDGEEFENLIHEKASWLASNPVGTNYDISAYSYILPVGISTFVEFIPSKDKYYWMSDTIPRVLTVKEFKKLIADKNTITNTYNKVKISVSD